MDDVRALGRFAAACIATPRSAFARAREFGMTHETLWSVIALIAIVRVVQAVIVAGVNIPIPYGSQTIFATPFTYAVILFSISAITVFVLHYTARMLGGTGEFADALLYVALLDGVLMVLVIGQLLLLLLVPGLLTFGFGLSLAIATMCLLNYITEAEGFSSIFKALLTIVLAIAGAGFGLGVLMAIISTATQISG